MKDRAPSSGMVLLQLKGVQEECLNRVQWCFLKNSAWLNGKIFTVVIAVNVKPQASVPKKPSASEAARCLGDELRRGTVAEFVCVYELSKAPSLKIEGLILSICKSH